MTTPRCSLRSLPPKGAQASFGAARQESSMTRPPNSLRSLPPKGAQASFGAARQES
jgi:hypothetical protein